MYNVHDFMRSEVYEIPLVELWIDSRTQMLGRFNHEHRNQTSKVDPKTLDMHITYNRIFSEHNNLRPHCSNQNQARS